MSSLPKSNPKKPTPALAPTPVVVALLASFAQRTLVLGRPGSALSAVCLALMLQTKNLFNTVHFAVNNVRTAYEPVESGGHALKADLHEHQIIALDRFNAVIEQLNTDRSAKYAAALAAGGDKAEKALKAGLVLLPQFEPHIDSLYRALLDITVLDNVMRTWPNQKGVAIYSRLPAKAAQLVLHRYRAAWTGFFESLKVFQAGGSAMTGRPRPPDYLAKNDRFVLELPLTQIGERLIGLGDRVIPVDFVESLALTEVEMTAWNDYRICDAVVRACAGRGFETGQAQHLRIVPHKQGVKFEVVVRVPRELPADSLLAQLEVELGAELPDSGAKRNVALVEALQRFEGRPAAGLDFGVSNTAAIGFTTGHRALVISGARLDVVLGGMGQELDALIGRLTTLEMRALQARKTALQDAGKGEKLPRADEMTLRKALKELYADPGYRALRGQRERWLNDYLHKLSCGIVRSCVKRGVQALVLGQNKGWKDGSNLGRTENRRFGRIPHARLVELIRYKAEAEGIVVVTTEESYTSKTSFVNDEVLPSLTEERKQQKEEAKKLKASKALPQSKSSSEAAAATFPLAKADTTPSPAPAVPRAGKRLKDKRHTFVNFHQTGRWARVHADVNAAFNMVRKVFKGFAFHAKLTLKYTVMRVSTRQGLTVARI